MARRIVGQVAKPVIGYDVESLKNYKKKCKTVIRDFRLNPELTKELIERINEAENEAQVSQAMADARKYL